jgi:hypothetical protein
MTPTQTIADSRPRAQVGSPLTLSDIAALKRVGIAPYMLDAAGWRRVSHAQAREQCGVQYKSDHLEGIAIPYLDPENEERVLTYRVRRDNPEVESNGTPIAKYVSPPDRQRLYFGVDAYSQLADVSAPAIVVESEKAVLAVISAEVTANRRHALVIATRGCNGWKGVIGKATSPNGTRVDEKGPLTDFDRVALKDRDTIIAFDANTATNEKVRFARRGLAAELEKRGARVRLLDLPVEDGVNGPDDFIGKHGAGAFFALVDAAKPTSDKKPTKAKPEKAKQGRDVQFENVDPWADPVDGAPLLEQIAAMFNRYLALPPHTSTALALWVLHSFTFDVCFASPLLAITSPAKRCGKTLLLIVLGALVPRRLFTANVTPAVLL